MLEDHLLYAGEQQQFRDIVGKKTGKGGKGSSVGKGRGYKEVVLNTPPSSVYGVEHLIRLFGKLYVCTTKSLCYMAFCRYSKDSIVPITSQVSHIPCSPITSILQGFIGVRYWIFSVC